MLGWESPKAVSKIHSFCEVAGLVSFASAITFEVFQMPRSSLTGFTVLVAFEIVRYVYGRREKTFSDREITTLAESSKEANLARARIEEKFKPRKLDSATLDQMVVALAPHAGLRVDVFAFDNHLMEVRILAGTLDSTFNRAGCISRLWLPGAGNRMVGEDITFGIARECPPEEQRKLLEVV